MLDLALVFLKIGAAAYGGGWTIVGIIRTEIVGRGWMTAEAFAELVGIAQVTPGPIALNAATLVGYRTHGLWGAVLATLSVVAVPLAVAALVSGLTARPGARGSRLVEALKSGTMGLLAMTLWAFAPSAVASWPAAACAVAAFAISAFTKVNPVWIILAAGVLGAAARTILG